MTTGNRTDDAAQGKESGAGRLVAVTGATGYLGSHVVQQLLGAGYRVRAVVRDPGNAENVGHLQSLVEAPAHPLELVAGDIMRPESLAGAVADCELVCHMASSVRLFARDPQREIVDVAVQGTKNVLEAIRAAGAAKRVVLTSSIAAVAGDNLPPDHVFTEADWNDSADLKVTPYLLSKTLAERAAWQFHGALPEDERFELVALNPSVVMGPLFKKAHVRSSPNTLRDLLVRKIPGCPRIYLAVVDVRDVAWAHLRALELPDVQGRYILHAQGLWMQEMARIIAPRFPRFPVPTWRLPDLVLYGASFFDKRLSLAFLRRNLGKSVRIDNSRSQRELGLRYRPVEETLVDTCESFIALGLARPKK
ncbi:MAG: NAD-dependent epimerase/dehydratase family protein [bacterium]